jgi:hypothetical protein
MTDFEEDKKDMMEERLEDLLEQVFSGSYAKGSTEAAIRTKVRELRQQEKGIKKGLVVVAHPDDEFLFVHNLVKQELGIDWTILCATWSPESPRGRRFAASCSLMGATPEYLGLEDKVGEHLAFSSIDRPRWTQFFKEFDVVYTHNKLGEYGHIHHQDCHRWVTINYGGELWVFVYNYKIPEVTYRDEDKPVSFILNKIYQGEAEFLKTFDLITEGFIKIERRSPCTKR